MMDARVIDAINPNIHMIKLVSKPLRLGYWADITRAHYHSHDYVVAHPSILPELKNRE